MHERWLPFLQKDTFEIKKLYIQHIISFHCHFHRLFIYFLIQLNLSNVSHHDKIDSTSIFKLQYYEITKFNQKLGKKNNISTISPVIAQK